MSNDSKTYTLNVVNGKTKVNRNSVERAIVRYTPERYRKSRAYRDWTVGTHYAVTTNEDGTKTREYMPRRGGYSFYLHDNKYGAYITAFRKYAKRNGLDLAQAAWKIVTDACPDDVIHLRLPKFNDSEIVKVSEVTRKFGNKTMKWIEVRLRGLAAFYYCMALSEAKVSNIERDMEDVFLDELDENRK